MPTDELRLSDDMEVNAFYSSVFPTYYVISLRVIKSNILQVVQSALTGFVHPSFEYVPRFICI